MKKLSVSQVYKTSYLATQKGRRLFYQCCKDYLKEKPYLMKIGYYALRSEK